jgi:proteasome assembly chaperone (PAC2) family protein
MPEEVLKLLNVPKLHEATMLLALTGWMDGGAVSTGTLRAFMGNRQLAEIAQIAPDPFYIYNFPGSMEISAMFRPEVKIKRGLIRDFDMPLNAFLADIPANLVFFVGKEPNLRWQQFADCIFDVIQRVGVTRIIFMGSFGGNVPHTREPRMFGSVSHKSLRPLLESHGVRLSDYTGPASFSTLLLSQAQAHEVQMLSLVAEIPGYLQGVNPMSIETVARRLAHILNLHVDIAPMREASNAWEQQVTEAVQQDEQLAETVRKLEDAYDRELVEREGPATPGDTLPPATP